MNICILLHLSGFLQLLQILYKKYSFTFIMMSSYTVSEANKGGNVRIIEAISCNHYCNGIAISARYCERVFVALGIQRAPYCHLWPAPLYTIFSTLSHKHHGFRKKKLLTIKACFSFLYKFV